MMFINDVYFRLSNTFMNGKLKDSKYMYEINFYMHSHFGKVLVDKYCCPNGHSNSDHFSQCVNE